MKATLDATRERTHYRISTHHYPHTPRPRPAVRLLWYTWDWTTRGWTFIKLTAYVRSEL